MKKTLVSLFCAGILFFLTSCSGITGYSVLLWSIPEHKLQDTDVVPVYIKSNISHVYVIGIPDTKEKIEIPLWQITEPQKKRKALKLQQRFIYYKHQYALAKIDGLPIRSDPVNTSKQVYRLRKNESIKLLYKGNGTAPMSGKSALKGEWLKVLTQNGTTGWCFSYNLKQLEMDSFGTFISDNNEAIQEEDIILKKILAKRWYPDSYTAMIRDQHIDVNRMNSSYGFETGAESGTVKLTMPGINVNWQYNGVKKTPEDTYKYNDVPIEITVRNQDFIVVRYMDESGKPQDFNLVTIEENIDELVANELKRRTDEYARLYENGGKFKSSNYGQIQFNIDGTFSWRGYNRLVPSLIVKNAGNTGTVSIKYFISNSLKSNYTGILTLKFEKMNKELNFLYELDGKNIRLTDAGGASFRGTTVQNLGPSPLILYFAGQ
ncbi:MAG: SH3 domain-containing protein [Treponema sp.]|nr:SH3 domain-containing protein [Treponema sp.]